MFEDVPGQGGAAALLRAALRSGRRAHAYLFLGPAGVGRLAMARELAARLLCPSVGEERCGTCMSCRSFDAAAHPDYHEVGVPEGKQALPIELIRSLQHHASVKPHLAPCRVFVVRDTEKMNLESANCFLKTLEEPPGGCCFILIAAGLWDMPQTVVSRCQVIKFSNLPPGHVQQALCDGGLDAEAAWWLARRSWGSPGLALSFKDIGLHLLSRELAKGLFALTPEGTYGLSDWLCEQAAATADSTASERVALQELLECVAVFYRDSAALAVAPGEVELFDKGLEDRLRQFVSRLSIESLIECADRTFEAIERLGSNANSRVVLDDLFTALAATTEHP